MGGRAPPRETSRCSLQDLVDPLRFSQTRRVSLLRPSSFATRMIAPFAVSGSAWAWMTSSTARALSSSVYFTGKRETPSSNLPASTIPGAIHSVALSRVSLARPAVASSMRSTQISSPRGAWPSGESHSGPSPNPSVRISLVSRLRREEGGCFSQKLVVLFQIEVLPPQPCQFSSFVLVQRTRGLTVGAASVFLGFDPGTQGLFTDSNFLGHRGDRPDGIDDEIRGLDPVFRG